MKGRYEPSNLSSYLTRTAFPSLTPTSGEITYECCTADAENTLAS
jgi:hypothetical protein